MGRFFLIFSYALRDASRSRVVLSLVVVSLGISFAAVLASASILTGFKGILDQGAFNDSGDLVIGPAGTSTTLADVDAITAKLDTMPAVAAWSIRTYALGSVHYGNKYILPLTIRGVDPDKETGVTGLGAHIVEGSYLSDARPGDVVLGTKLADALQDQAYDTTEIAVGEKIEVDFLGEAPQTYTVAGIFDAQNFVPNWILYLDKKELDRAAPFLKDAEVALRLTDESELESVKAELQNSFPGDRVLTWQDNSGYIRDIETVVGFITLLINRLLIAAVCVIICVIIFISVLQKRRQIGIMKSMGAGKSFIIAAFMLETMVYSLLAYGVGFFLFYIIYRFSIANPTSTLIGNFMLAFDPATILQTSVVLLVASLAGCFFPAYIAARTEIINVLKD